MAPSGSESPAETIAGLKNLLVDYAKQETIDPLRNAKNYLAYGLGGAVFVALGLFLLAMALLRLLQTEGPSWVTGNLSWLPYAFTLIGLGIAIAVLVRLIQGGSK